ncbi:hypothetical protein ACFQQB_26130 [Nonomuraea rubra]|uniref:hypothetical protein n=1 Tax=Nonomuraea rubra TaxID=46180 RepID=UPI003611B213
MVQVSGRDPSVVEGVAGEQGVGDLQQILGGRFGGWGIMSARTSMSMRGFREA